MNATKERKTMTDPNDATLKSAEQAYAKLDEIQGMIDRLHRVVARQDKAAAYGQATAEQAKLCDYIWTLLDVGVAMELAAFTDRAEALEKRMQLLQK
jgi:hypothetical protein